MNQNTVTGDYININLRQLGATSIKEFNSIMHIAEFDLGDGLIVSYVFNITRHNKYFLQRMQPYAMVHGKFASDQEIIDFITGICEAWSDIILLSGLYFSRMAIRCILML